MKRNHLFNFLHNPTCPECGSTNVNLENSFSEPTKKGYSETDYLVCEECGHRYQLRYSATLVGYKPNDGYDEISGEVIENKEERIK